MKEPDKKEIRPCLVSGLFYPDNKEELQKLIEKEMEPFTPGRSSLILTPHGSFSTAGQCLAASYAACRERAVETVLLMGPVHREKKNPALYLPGRNYFSTPFGPVPVDCDVKKKLLKESSLFQENDMPHMEEHCLEVQLPFVHYLFPDAQIIPLLMGNLNKKQISGAAEHIKKIMKDKWDSTLTVLSVNLSDFQALEESRRMADNLIDMLEFPLRNSLIEEEKNGTVSSCGTRVLSLASELFPRAGKAQLLHLQHTKVQDHGLEKGVYYGGFSWEESN